MRRSPLPTSRRVRAAALAVAPVVVLLAVPASAAVTVAVTPAPEGCGVVVALTGLGEGSHTAVVRTTVLGTGEPVPVVPADAAPGTPQLTAVGTLSADGRLVVALDAAAVPDTDPSVAVAVTVDDEASAPVELALPGCGAPTTGTPTTGPTATRTSAPSDPPTTTPTTAPTTGASTAPEPERSAPAPAGPTASTSPTPSAATTASPTTSSASPAASATPRPTTAPSTLTPVAASPVLTGAPVPSPTPSLSGVLEQAYGASTDGTGDSGYLSLMSFAAAPQLDTTTAADPVPAPVIAAPEGSAAGVLAAPEGSDPLSELLPRAPEGGAGDDTITAQLAAPDLATDAAADPLVDLAPAAFVLSASLGGLLVAGRRRSA